MNRHIFQRKWMHMLMLLISFVCAAVAFDCEYISDAEQEKSVQNNVLTEEVATHAENSGQKCLMPVGASVGIHIQTNGLMVLGTAEIRDENGEMTKPSEEILQVGDYILQVNGQNVTDTDQMTDILDSCHGQMVNLTIERDGKVYERTVNPAKISRGEYKIGVWLRDDTQGIGTLSFVDENNHFAALGHGITDLDTGDVVSIRGGGLYPASIYAIVKGQQGIPGELVGQIAYGSGICYGRVTDNNYQGIYGILNKNSKFSYDASKALISGAKEEMKIGPAAIQCQISSEIKNYDIMITGIDYNGGNQNRDFIINVTDEELLAATGGIVQGMSGSPIIQDGKIIGVLTHVFVNDPTRGYGIFIENMLEH